MKTHRVPHRSCSFPRTNVGWLDKKKKAFYWELTVCRDGGPKDCLRRVRASSSIVPREITDINVGIGICIVAIKYPLRHAMAQLPDSGDAFVISRSRSDSPRCLATVSRASPFVFLALWFPLTPDGNFSVIRTRTPAYHRSTLFLRFRGELFLKRDSLTRRAFSLLPLRRQTFRISIIYTPLVSGGI